MEISNRLWLYIGGEWREGKGGAFASRNPGNDEVYGKATLRPPMTSNRP